jgi:hypothetical protein
MYRGRTVAVSGLRGATARIRRSVRSPCRLPPIASHQNMERGSQGSLPSLRLHATVIAVLRVDPTPQQSVRCGAPRVPAR